MKGGRSAERGLSPRTNRASLIDGGTVEQANTVYR